MAVELVAGALLSYSLQFLFERIGSGEVLAYLRGKSKSRDIDQILGKLKKVFNSVMAVIEDAEQKRRNSKSVEVWLDMLQEAVFDAEDLLDVIETEAMELKAKDESGISMSEKHKIQEKKFRNFFLPSHSSEAGDLEGKIKKLLERVEDIASQKDFLGLEQSTNHDKVFRRLPSTSLVNESEIYGRENDKSKILNFLLSDDTGNENICVVSIVGMGGVGKTTLAQATFNDKKVKERFELMAWVCVSEEFDVCRVTKAILEEVTSRSCDVAELNSVQVKLKERLSGKRFLIVLDDVWHEKPAGLDVLFLPFKDGAQGSRIIVTTRSEKVASSVRAVHTHYMTKLSEDACWQLFAMEAAGYNGDLKLNEELEMIGREIVTKCDGLPLALKTLGGLLRSTHDVREWRRILASDIWDLREDESEILPALKLSYHYLPSQLKRCFAFCSIFPTDYRFEKDELILLWMAENILECPSRNGRIEDVGEEYFNGLVSRSFFQKLKDSVFVMHDLIHELAKSISTEYCMHLDDEVSSKVKMSKIRHLGYAFRDVDPYRRFSDVLQATNLRTFLSMDKHYCFRMISRDIVTDMLLKLRRLRVLSLYGYNNVDHLPDSIGELRHLRYLDVSCTKISTLPESMCNLFNLQTLKLKSCWRLKNLPKRMHHLINMRHLDLRDCSNLVEMPASLSNLKKLQTLGTFIVGNDNGTKIGELRELLHIRGELYIRKLERVGDPKNALDEANLLDKKHLDFLSLEWSLDNYDDTKHATDVLEMLIPHKTLKKLWIYGYRGRAFPDWLGLNSMDCIVSLRLSNCANCTSLPPLGNLPSLKILDISNFNALVDVGPEFYGDCCKVKKPFQSLEILRFSGMETWETWSQDDSGAFSHLKELHIHGCRNFTGVLPCFLPSLTEFRISDCEKLAFALPRIPCVRVLIVSGCKDIMHVESSIEALKCMDSCEFIELSLGSSHIQIPIGCLPSSLKYLVIQEWKGLKIKFDSPHMSLEELSIDAPDSFKSLPIDYFPKLKKLTIRALESLESLSISVGLQSQSLSTSLTSLHISGCSSLVHFPDGGLFAPNLTHLRIRDCNKLKFLPEKMFKTLISLKLLTMDHCPEIESLPGDVLPSSLTEVKIFDCERFVASRENWGLERLPNLIAFIIKGGNEDMESFPEEGLLPGNILTLEILGFPWLKSLEKNAFRKLTSLKKLGIDRLPKLHTIPGEAMSYSLKYLSISECNELQICSKEDLPTSLEGLNIKSCRNCQIVLQKGLPVTLKTLVIDSCDDLKSIPIEGLPASLKSLVIRNCEGLKNMPVKSLTSLEIVNCSNLKTMAAKHFSNSLTKLKIEDCPLLAKKCKPEKGEYWNYISRVPYLNIDGDIFIS